MIRSITHLGGATATLGAGVTMVSVGGGWTEVGLVALLANVLSHGAVQLLKRTVVRPRPCDAAGRPLALVPWPDPYGFPSGHSAAAVSVAFPVTMYSPGLAVVALPLAGIVAYSRIHLKLHDIWDVAAGSLLGALGVAVASALVP